MKHAFVLLSFCLFCFSYSASSQNKKTITVKAGSSIAETLTAEDIYRYPQFTYGIAHLKDGKTLGAKLNYNLLLQDMQFITRNNDTLSVINETLDHIVINRDTFYYDKGYVELYLGHPQIKLAVMQHVVFSEKQKIGGYGMPNSSSSIETLNQLSIGSNVQKLTANEDQVLIWETNFFIGNGFNHFVMANKKNLLDMFPKYRAAIKDYLNENNVNFNKEDDIIKMIKYLQKIPI